MMKNAFYFVLKALFVLKIFTLEFQIEGEGGINVEAGKFRPK